MAKACSVFISGNSHPPCVFSHHKPPSPSFTLYSVPALVGAGAMPLCTSFLLYIPDDHMRDCIWDMVAQKKSFVNVLFISPISRPSLSWVSPLVRMATKDHLARWTIRMGRFGLGFHTAATAHVFFYFFLALHIATLGRQSFDFLGHANCRRHEGSRGIFWSMSIMKRRWEDWLLAPDMMRLGQMGCILRLVGRVYVPWPGWHNTARSV